MWLPLYATETKNPTDPLSVALFLATDLFSTKGWAAPSFLDFPLSAIWREPIPLQNHFSGILSVNCLLDVSRLARTPPAPQFILKWKKFKGGWLQRENVLNL
jgi:hypothetical protein